MSAQKRETFDEVAELYDQVRPDYPAQLFDDLVSLSGLPESGRVLEVGAGTGISTLPLAERGYRVVAVELGDDLAAVARKKLSRSVMSMSSSRTSRIGNSLLSPLTSSRARPHGTGSIRSCATRKLPTLFGQEVRSPSLATTTSPAGIEPSSSRSRTATSALCRAPIRSNA